LSIKEEVRLADLSVADPVDARDSALDAATFVIVPVNGETR